MKVILDSGIFMNLSHIPDLQGDLYMSEITLSEVKSYTAQHILDLAMEKYGITVLDPPYDAIEKIKSAARKMGQGKLSDQDIEVLALALFLSGDDEVLILSDDYGLRNVAHEVKIPSRGIKTQSGNQRRLYKFICNACGASYPHNIDECDVCGHNSFKRRRR